LIELEEKQEADALGDFEHYMLKEIYEIPNVLKNALA
jgi:glucosamine 6-phosphate synthetase-like amidotransferase/phosphosugar isomerase protein